MFWSACKCNKKLFIDFSKTTKRKGDHKGFLYRFLNWCFPYNISGMSYVCGKKESLFDPLLGKVRKMIDSWLGCFLNTGGKLVLINHVLHSVLAYTIAAIDPPSSVVKAIERMIANFFWGQLEGKAKSHWVAWQKCCRPKDEGGLGIKSLKEMIQAYSYCLWWKLRTGTSLWSSYMRARYWPSCHPLQASSQVGSPLWKRLVKVRQEVDGKIHWLIRNGDIHATLDRWILGHQLPPNINLKVNELFSSDMDLKQEVSLQLSITDLAAIKEQHIRFQEKPDIPCWTLTSNGVFTISSAWNALRPKASTSLSSKYIWHKYVPNHISVFMWKLWQLKLPLDEGLQQKGFQLASKCVCCLDSNSETFNHVFLSSHLALQLWTCLGRDCGIITSQGSIKQACFSWWLQGSRLAPQLYIIPSLILWELWKERNRILFDGHHSTALGIIKIVRNEVCAILLAAGLPTPSNWVHKLAFQNLGFQGSPAKNRRAMAVSWVKPAMGKLKLNTDGCSRGNPGLSGGGGVLRNGSGGILYAYASFYGHYTNMYAETMALHQGVCWLRDNDHHSVIVEVDSKALLDIVLNHSKVPWKCWHLISNIQHIGSILHLSFQHCYREANMVADSLANEGCDTRLCT